LPDDLAFRARVGDDDEIALIPVGRCCHAGRVVQLQRAGRAQHLLDIAPDEDRILKDQPDVQRRVDEKALADRPVARFPGVHHAKEP
jgi:hypothetical protein